MNTNGELIPVLDQYVLAVNDPQNVVIREALQDGHINRLIMSSQPRTPGMEGAEPFRPSQGNPWEANVPYQG